MKIKRRVFEKDGQWYMGRTNSKGQEIACCCRDKAAAEQLLHLAESCYRPLAYCKILGSEEKQNG